MTFSNWYVKQEQEIIDQLRERWEDVATGRALIVVSGNSDLTEGRGPYKELYRGFDPLAAMRARWAYEGVQGGGRNSPGIDTLLGFETVPTPVERIGTFEDFLNEAFPSHHPLYMAHDPEYAEYLRLKERFS